jgi:hypothetical protein
MLQPEQFLGNYEFIIYYREDRDFGNAFASYLAA